VITEQQTIIQGAGSAEEEAESDPLGVVGLVLDFLDAADLPGAAGSVVAALDAANDITSASKDEVTPDESSSGFEKVVGLLEAGVGAATVEVVSKTGLPFTVAAGIVAEYVPLVVLAADAGVVAVSTAAFAVAGYKLRMKLEEGIPILQKGFDVWAEAAAAESGPVTDHPARWWE
jgi:hypothetical protein